MKNFLNQTWVVALLVAVVLTVVCYIAFKKKKEEVAPAPSTPADETTTEK